MDEFKVKLDEFTDLVSVSREVNGVAEEVQLDPSNGRFIEFLNWYFSSGNDYLAKGFRAMKFGSAVVFNSLVELLKFFKDNSCVLMTSASGKTVVRKHRFTWVGGSTSMLELKFANDPHGWRKLVLVTEAVYDLIVDSLGSLDGSDSEISKHCNLAVDRTFVYVDVSDFSQMTPEIQLVVITTLIRIVHDDELWGVRIPLASRDAIDTSVCIGDGYIFVFKNASLAAFFSACLACIIERGRDRLDEWHRFHYRIAVHSGSVYRFWDKPWGGSAKWNYTGRGINDARRVLEAIGPDKDDVVYVSGAARDAMRQRYERAADRENLPNSDGLECMQNRGRHRDKHENLHRLYELDHVRWARDVLPRS